MIFRLESPELQAEEPGIISRRESLELPLPYPYSLSSPELETLHSEKGRGREKEGREEEESGEERDTVPSPPTQSDDAPHNDNNISKGTIEGTLPKLDFKRKSEETEDGGLTVPPE